MSQKILKKLTIATLVGGVDVLREAAQSGAAKIPDPDKPGKMILPPTGKPVAIARILGQVHSIKAGQHKETGTEFVKLFGSFKGTNMLTGEIVPDCGMCLVPNFIASSIAAAVASGSGVVEFGVTILVKHSTRSPVGYEYEAETLMPVQVSPGIAALEARIESLALEAPAPAAKLEAPKAKGKGK